MGGVHNGIEQFFFQRKSDVEDGATCVEDKYQMWKRAQEQVGKKVEQLGPGAAFLPGGERFRIEGGGGNSSRRDEQ